jgi:hypothetical protein
MLGHIFRTEAKHSGPRKKDGERKSRELARRVEDLNGRGRAPWKGRRDPVGGRNLPGKSCSTRKQSERAGPATVQREAFGAKGPARPDQRALRP